MYEVTKDLYEISVWEDVLVEAEEQKYELVTSETPENEAFYKFDNGEYIKLGKDEAYEGDKYVRIPRKLSHFKEEKIAVIGANDHNAPELAYNPKFVDDVKGEHTLTFTMNGKYYDKDLETFVDNPYIKLLTNERKIKLFFRNEWYDLVIKKVEESKKNYAYTYTATDLFINELGKNGFKVELDTELENNQGTATELASLILEDTDWQVSSPFPLNDESEEYKSDLIVENNLDTLYKAYLCKDILVKVSANGWLPIREEDIEPAFIPEVDGRETEVIKKGEQIYLFYSDLISKNEEPMILYRACRKKDEDGNYSAGAVSVTEGGEPVYQVNDNEDIIINSYNFRVTRENKVTYNDDDVPLPDFIVYDEYMPIELSISSDSTKWFYNLDKDGKIQFINQMPEEGYRGKTYQKQDEGKWGITLEDKCRAYETVRRAETGYDPVTDEFITYFLKRLYTKTFVKTTDTIPYSNKAYFTREKIEDNTATGENIEDDYKYTRYYGYSFGVGDYYELQYNEFLKDGEPLNDETQYYVKSQIPEYVPTTDVDVNYYIAVRYQPNVQYFYYNEVIRQYIGLHFNSEEEFNNFGKKIYYRENKQYYVYNPTINEYVEYGKYDLYTPSNQFFSLGETNQAETIKQTYVEVPDNLDYYVYDYERHIVDEGHIFNFTKNTYSTLNIDTLLHEEAIDIKTNEGIIRFEDGDVYALYDKDYKEVSLGATYDATIDYYTQIKVKSTDSDPIAGKKYYIKNENNEMVEQENLQNFKEGAVYYENRYEKATVAGPFLNDNYYVRILPTYYYYSKGTEQVYRRVEFPKLVKTEDVYTANKYFLHSIATSLPLYKGVFVYEQSGKWVNGYIKYEDSEWSRLKGYAETEYLSPTLVQNFLANSTEISTESGWVFDGAPSSKDRAGELTNRLDDPTLPDPDEDPTSSLLILHLTDKPVYYASQTGEYLYTSYDFMVSNPMITNEEFWDNITPYFEKEVITRDIKTPEYKYEEVTPQQVKEKYRNRIIYQIKGTDSGGYKVNSVPGNSFITESSEGIKWVDPDPNYHYYIKTDPKYDFYCKKLTNGTYQSVGKIYIKDGDAYQRVLKCNNVDENSSNWKDYYIYDKGEFKQLGFTEANKFIKNATYYTDQSLEAPTKTFNNKWDFYKYGKQLYFYHYVSEEEFYAIVGYDADTTLYGFKYTKDEYLIHNKAYYKIDTNMSELNSTNTMYFVSTNNFNFEGGVNQYFTYDAKNDKYNKVSYGAEVEDGMVYYEFKPTGKMHYLPYDYYRDAWESAAIRDYLDNTFPSPGYEAYVPFTPLTVSETVEGKTYWAKRTDGTYEKLDDYALRNYMGDYVYEQWEEDAIAELQSIFKFEYVEDELTEYARDLLDLVSDLLDWADYEQESRIDFLNAIDLFGIKRQILLSKLRRLEKNYPDVESYQREDLLKYLGLLKTELNQDLRIEMSVIADPQVVDYVPTQDIVRKANKKYYYFEQPDHGNGQVSRSFKAVEYTEDVFYSTTIDGVEYKIRVDDSQDNSTSLASLIIYEFTGELPDLLETINDGIKAVSDDKKADTLKLVKKELETVRLESSWSYLNPLRMYQAYQALLKIRGWLKDGTLMPDERDEDVYNTILQFYKLFVTGNNPIDDTIWIALGFISNDAIPFYIQSLFSKAKIDYSVQETTKAIDEWLTKYFSGERTEYYIYKTYSGAEIKKLLEKDSEIEAYYSITTYKLSSEQSITKYTSTDSFKQIIFNKNNINTIVDEDIYYIKSITSNNTPERTKDLYYHLQQYSQNNITYVKVDTSTEVPNPNEKYYFKEIYVEKAGGQSPNSQKRYFTEEGNKYKEITNEIQNHLTTKEDGTLVIQNDVYVFVKYQYIEIPEEITSWEEHIDSTGKANNEYYRKENSFIDYSKSITFNNNLYAALKNLEEVIALRYDDVNELKTGNKIFDDVTKAITGFTIIWHLEKEERAQVVEGTKLLVNLSKQLTALQISDDFIDFCLDRRYEGHKRRALNTGFAANRTTIKKLNKGEEYVFALSLGRYYDDGKSEPPSYTRKGSFSYGDIENKYYYFDNDPSGIGDYALGTDDYKEILSGEANYNTPYGWMESEGRFELATNDDTINPLFVCIGQEVAKDKFVTRFVSPSSSAVSQVFYYEEENGDYFCVRRPEGLFKTVKVYEKADEYKWFNGSLDQVLMKDGKWKVLFSNRKDNAKRFRRSPTYVCLAPTTEAEANSEKEVTLGCIPYDLLGHTYREITDKERATGPLTGTTYFTYNKFTEKYEEATDLKNGFDVNTKYYVILIDAPKIDGGSIQYFKRSTDNLSEGRYKMNTVSTINHISSDGDFYKILTTSELARGPERNTTYYIYDEGIYKKVEIEKFEEGKDYYCLTYERNSFSLYSADDLTPDLFCFVPDNNGDYVHIIRKEEVEEVAVKWYQFWLRDENLNKIYREFKDTDELSTDVPHYFKRYNSAMDYDYHATSWKDGHLGPWKERYQRYSKFRVHLYDNTELDESYSYWISNPFSDGSECYTLYTREQPRRFTLHKRYLGFENGVHKYLTLKEAKAKTDPGVVDTVHKNVNYIKFSPPGDYKNYMNKNNNSTGVNYHSGGFVANYGIEMIPVKIATRTYRPFENETDSQRVPYIMLKSSDNIAPSAGVDWIYCQSQNASDFGYYRECTVDDTNAYTNWQISEGIDQALGLYKFLKVKDPINWNSDTPPFKFATPVEISMLSHEYAMRVIKCLNTPYWWGRTRYHTAASYPRTQSSFERFINFVRDFWEWGDRVFISSIWRWITNAENADQFTRGLEYGQDKLDEKLEKLAALIRKTMYFFDFSENDNNAHKILSWIDNNGVDIYSDDPDYLLVNYKTPIPGINYYTKVKGDNGYVYKPWEHNGVQGDREFKANTNYFVLEAEQKAPQEWLFRDLDNNYIGVIKYATGSPTITYHYFPSQTSGYFEAIDLATAQKEFDAGKAVCYVNAENEGNGTINLVPIKTEDSSSGKTYTLGEFIKFTERPTDSNLQCYHFTSYNETDTDNLSMDTRLNFWDAMYGLYGSAWSNIVEREAFGAGGTHFLNAEDEFTDEVLEELYSFTEIWVKEIQNGLTKFIPFDSILHDAKPKFYRHTYSGELKDAVDGITEIYYNDGGVYKYYATKDDYDTVIPINYDGLKVSFCEYDYEASNYRISPVQIEDSYETNLDYSNHHKVYLDFDCSDPIQGYFDLTVSPEIQEDLEGNLITPAIKERYIWWKAPVQHNYNLTEDLYSRVGTLFYTDNKSLKSYPINGALLFKYKTYKSNNIEVLKDLKMQFYEYETTHIDTYEPTFEEYKTLKEAFKGYFGIDEWNKVENLMDIRYDGTQRDFTTYESYLEMLNAYLTEDGERNTYLKNRIIYNPETGQYSFKFKNRCPVAPSGKTSIDKVKLKLSYYNFNDIGTNNNGWPATAEKVVSYGEPLENYLNKYEWQEANKDLQVPLADFDNIDLNRFNTLFKNLAYKYSMYEISSEERADPSDVYYSVKAKEGEESAVSYYELETHDGFSSLPTSKTLYLPRTLQKMEIQNPEYVYTPYSFIRNNEENRNNKILSKAELETALANKDFYWFGYKLIENHDAMFKFAEVGTQFSSGIKYYKKVDSLWTFAEETVPLGNISYYTWITDNTYYRENCEYKKAESIKDKKYNPKYSYYMHEDYKGADGKIELERKAAAYGELYPYTDSYIILNDIDEDVFEVKKANLYQRTKNINAISYQNSLDYFVNNSKDLYIKYWYPLFDVKSQIQFEKYFAGGKPTGEAPNGIYYYDYNNSKKYFRGGLDVYKKNGTVYTLVDAYEEYNPELTYYYTTDYTILTPKQLETNYLIIEPYEEVTASTPYNPDYQYWTYAYVFFDKEEGYRNDTRYYVYNYEWNKVADNAVYESDVIYGSPLAVGTVLYDREITIEAKLSASIGGGTKANLRVTYQILDGINGIWPFEPELYEDVMLWPNPNEGYLARRIEELASLHRKDQNFWEKIVDPNPFYYFVCDGVYSDLIGADYIEEGKTYEVTVTLDSRLLTGHHDISEDCDPNELTFLSSLNEAVSNWWDQQIARQEVLYKKINQSVNDFWNSLSARIKGERVVEESPETNGTVNNGNTIVSKAEENGNAIYDESINKLDNRVYMRGEWRDPNIITKSLPNEIEQNIRLDDALKQLDKAIKDGAQDFIGFTRKINKIITQNTNRFKERVKRIKTEKEGTTTTEKVTVDYVEEDSSKVAKSTKDVGSKAVSGIVSTGKWLANGVGNRTKGNTGQTGTTILDEVANDQATNLSISGKMTSELQRSLILANSNANGGDSAGMVTYMVQMSKYLYEVAEFVTYIQQLGYYDFMRDYKYLSNIETFYTSFEEKYSTPEFINRILAGIYRATTTGKRIMALPGEIPDNNDLILTNYYLYYPDLPGQDDEDTLVYDYVGENALDYYIYDYDDYCQKVRSIDIKEKNYLSALQTINEKFECWAKYELAHYTEEENALLPVMDYDKAHTPGEVKMVERAVWVAEDDETDIFFDPINILNSHISDKQNKVISALTQFNPRDYWEERKDYVKWNGHKFEDGVTYYEETPTGAFKVTADTIPDGQITYYIKIENGNEEAVTNSESAEDKTYYKNILMIPLKTIYLKQFTGDLNYAGFRYGVNLKSIKRTLDSKELVSRLIVKENTNEHAMDGFCTIQRAAENPIKENFILNFDYYVQHQMLKREELWQDLYGLEDGYYSKLATINKNLEDLVDKIAEVNECLDRINANYETYSLARDAAQQEIEGMAISLAESMPDEVPSPWKYNVAKETEVLRTSWSDTQTKQFITYDKDGNPVTMTEHVVQGQTRSIEVPKYSEDTQKKIKQMDIFQRNYEKYRGWAANAKQQKETYEKILEDLYAKSDDMYRMKTNLNLLFFKKYYRFIQEGSWKEDDYMDDTLYYLDALAVARTSAFPKVTYDIQTIDLENLNDYIGYKFRIGDKTYIEDTEFFGYTNSGKPYQEETIVTKLEYHLDDASRNKITVTNYTTQFEDMFKRIAAAVSKVELSTGAYNRANAVINETAIAAPVSTTTTIKGLLETINGSLSLGAEGLVTTEIGVPSNKLKIVNGAVYRSTDGGATYQKILTADGGIDPSLIGGGKLDLTSLTIGSKDNPELSFTANGMTAFRKNDGTVDYSTFVRFDSYGMYGIKNYKRNSSTDNASNATLNDSFVPQNIDSIYENASYGLTWDGFFLKTGDGTGRVMIGTNQDLRMSVKNGSDAWSDRIVIGKLQDGDNDPYYGFRIIDTNDNVVLNTDDLGRLYLRHKLYISHFNDEYGTASNDEITVDKKLDQTNIALGIVKAYRRNESGGYDSGEDVHDNYSSLEYLTKVLSVKSVVDGYDLKGNLKDSNNYFKQFDEKQLKTLIDENENLAIFDNGNLYARNAWLEGNVRATSGNIIGKLNVGEKGSIVIDGENQKIFHSNNGWSINSDGTAYFNNAEISGTISAAVFSYDKIQSIGGAMLVRPSYKVNKHYFDAKKKYLYLELDAPDNVILEGFQEGNYCRFGQDFDSSFNPVHQITGYGDKYNIISINLTPYWSEFTIGEGEEKEIIYSNKYEGVNIESIISVKQKDIETYGIGLNSTTKTSIMPAESFSLLKMEIDEGSNLETTAEIILGKIPSTGKYSLPRSSLNQLVADSNGQYYGLYAKNVLLQGALTTMSGEYSAGISTNSVHKINDIDLIFWSGQNNTANNFAPNFYVNREGFLYAKNGLFEGEVASSIIRASTIIGNKTENKYGLTIIPEEGEGTTKAIVFGEGAKDKTSEEVNITKEYFSLKSSELYSSINLKIASLQNSSSINYNFGVLNTNNENCVGLFGKGDGNNTSNYLINFTIDENNKINLNYTGIQIATIDGDGIHTNQQDNSWGESVYLEELTHGCDIYVK